MPYAKTDPTPPAYSSVNQAKYVYAYDHNWTTGLDTMLGQRSSMTATVPSQGWTNKQTKYEYDALYELTKVTYPTVAPFSGEVDSWTYDEIGNRLTSTVNGVAQNYAYQKIGSNPLNWRRLLNDGVNAYTYDNDGNTLTKGTTSLTWNSDDRMTGVTGTASYAYDYVERRTSKTVGASTSTYLYDGINLIREAGASPADYVFGPNIDEPLAMSRGGQVYYYLGDGLGSVGLVTNTAGAVQNASIYDAWGQTRSQTGSLANPFGYTARETGEAGTLYYRARYYQPGIGRFLSEDQANDPGNLYARAGSDPIDWIDNDGLSRRTPTPAPTPTPTPKPIPIFRYIRLSQGIPTGMSC